MLRTPVGMMLAPLRDEEEVGRQKAAGPSTSSRKRSRGLHIDTRRCRGGPAPYADHLSGTLLLTDRIKEDQRSWSVEGLSRSCWKGAGAPANGQWAIRMGRVIPLRIVLVAPPSTNSRTREWA